MALQKITLESLTRFDMGKVAAAFDAELETVVADLRDRPMDGSRRTVTLTVELIPQPESQTGDCETAAVGFSVSSRVPKRKTRIYEMGVRKNSTLVANDLSPDNVKQATIDDEIARKDGDK